MKRYFKKKRFLRRYKSKYNRKFRRGFKKFKRSSYSKFKTGYRKKYGKKRIVRNLKSSGFYKTSLLLSGSEIHASSYLVNSNWVLLGYNLGFKVQSMYQQIIAENTKSRHLFFDPPEWLSVKLIKQSWDTPLFYPFLSDVSDFPTIKEIIQNKGINAFFKKYGIRTKPRAVNLIHGKKNDNCFNPFSVWLYILVPNQYTPGKEYIYNADGSNVNQQFAKIPGDLIPQNYQDPDSGFVLTQEVDSIQSYPDLFDYLLKIGCRSSYDKCGEIFVPKLDGKPMKDQIFESVKEKTKDETTAKAAVTKFLDFESKVQSSQPESSWSDTLATFAYNAVNSLSNAASEFLYSPVGMAVTQNLMNKSVPTYGTLRRAAPVMNG